MLEFYQPKVVFMYDEFTRQNRVASLDSLLQSIDELKTLHSELEVTTKAFKDSIAREKSFFSQFIGNPVEPSHEKKEPSSSSDDTNSTPGEQFVSSVDQDTFSEEQEDHVMIEGVMSTEKPSTIVSK
jgi:hypothetical protein